MKITLVVSSVIILALGCSNTSAVKKDAGNTPQANTSPSDTRVPSSQPSPEFLRLQDEFAKAAEIDTAFLQAHSKLTCVVVGKNGPAKDISINLVDRGNGIYEDFVDETFCQILLCTAYHSQFYRLVPGVSMKSTSPLKQTSGVNGTTIDTQKISLRQSGDLVLGEVQLDGGFIRSNFQVYKYLQCSSN